MGNYILFRGPADTDRRRSMLVLGRWSDRKVIGEYAPSWRVLKIYPDLRVLEEVYGELTENGQFRVTEIEAKWLMGQDLDTKASKAGAGGLVATIAEVDDEERLMGELKSFCKRYTLQYRLGEHISADNTPKHL